MDDYDPFRQLGSVIARVQTTQPTDPEQIVGGTRTQTKETNMKGHKDVVVLGTPDKHEPYVVHATRSIARTNKPARLTLVSSNGSTISSIALATCGSPVSTTTFKPTGVDKAASTPTSGPVSLQRHNLLPATQANRHPSNGTMGSSNSKSETDSSRASDASMGAVQLLRRKPVIEPKSWKTRMKTSESHHQKPSTAVRTSWEKKTNAIDERQDQSHGMLHGRPIKFPPRSDSLNAQDSSQIAALKSQWRSEQTTSLGSTSDRDSERESWAECPASRTPTVKSPRLPSPPRVDVETPSKYGIKPRVSDFSLNKVHLQLRSGDHQHNKNQGSIVLTALDLFHASTRLQKAHSHPNTTSISTSDLTTSTMQEAPLPGAIDPTTTSIRQARSTRMDIVNDKPTNHIASVTIAGMHSAPEKHRNATRPLSPNPLASSSSIASIIGLIPRNRNSNTGAPVLTVTQIYCLQQHRRWRLSGNLNAPVACALCFVHNEHTRDEEEEGQRWSCTWCALRVCLSCRDKVETHMDRDPTKALTGPTVRRLPWTVVNQEAPATITPKMRTRLLGDPISRSTSDLRSNARFPIRDGLKHDRRTSVDSSIERKPYMTDQSITPPKQRNDTRMSQVEYVDDDATPRRIEPRKDEVSSGDGGDSSDGTNTWCGSDLGN